jgi:two-component system CheB/CheR fusion protein
MRTPPEDQPQPTEHGSPSEDRDERALQDVLELLRTRTGRDFTYYKRATIVRRVARRAQVNGLDDVPSYLEFVRTHLGEAGALVQDLLISVTNFFRDKEVFQALEEMLPQLFRDKAPGDSLRVWVPACATGEEAYSIAMMLASYARRLDAPPLLQVFGSDLDESAIQVARNGSYPDTIVADVDPPYLRQWFTKESHGYRVRRELRELVMFASHDLLKDAPFSRIDLISCRNLLIYLDKSAQDRALEIFHFASRPAGILLLGSAETVNETSSLFEAVDSQHRIYKQVPGPKQALPALAGSSILARALAHEPTRGPVLPSAAFTQGAQRAGRPQSTNLRELLPPGELHVRLLERVAPPSLVVDGNLEIHQRA